MSRPRALLILTSCLACPAFAFAHGLGVEVTRFGETIRISAFFDTDDPADDCVVTVTAADGRIVATGKTDAKGEFAFPAPPAGDYVVVADAGAGHRAKKSFTIADSAAAQNETVRPSSPWTKWLGVGVGFLVILIASVIGKRLTSRNRVAIS